MEICNKDKCTGCGVCASVCAHSSIRMEEDSYGELHPVVNDLNCIQCGLCKKVCPNNTEPVFSYPQKCYAAWITDNIKRAKCASGGIATIMAEYVIKKGGVFFGTAYDFDFVGLRIFLRGLSFFIFLQFFLAGGYNDLLRCIAI